MKKFLLSTFSAVFLSSIALFGSSYTDRFFEVKLNTNVGISNNVLSLNNILVKNLQIDLRDIAKRIPAEGLKFSYNASPEFSLNFRIKELRLGFDAGVDASGVFSTSKDLFDFLGYGNELGDELDISLSNDMDIYAYLNAHLGFKTGNCKLMLQPTVFTPIFSMAGEMAEVSYMNDENGRILVRVASDLAIHSLFDLESTFLEFDLPHYFRHLGFDIGGSIDVPVNPLTSLKFETRIPIVPGSVSYTKHTVMEYEIDTQISSMESIEMETTSSDYYVRDDLYYVNRPLKFDVYVNYAPMGSLFNFCAGAGFGVFHPFVKNFYFYPEYYFGVDMSLARLITVGLSTEYTNQVFRHELSLDFNVRFVEIAAGVSMQSGSFTKSFAATGFGAYVLFALGF